MLLSGARWVNNVFSSGRAEKDSPACRSLGMQCSPRCSNAFFSLHHCRACWFRSPRCVYSIPGTKLSFTYLTSRSTRDTVSYQHHIFTRTRTSTVVSAISCLVQCADKTFSSRMYIRRYILWICTMKARRQC